jgi:hypothetical protein
MKYLDWQNSGRFRAMTGYDFCEFTDLLSDFEPAHDEYMSRCHLNGKPRSGVRRYTININSPLPCREERLAFILSCLKLNPIQEHHADTFFMTQKQCNDYLHGLKEILHRALNHARAVPASTGKGLQASLSSADIPDDKLLLHDAAEREIPRPEDDDLQKENYSGKKKKHTVKNAITVTACCLIIYVSKTFPGKVHDKTVADSEYEIPPGCTLIQDTGCQGYRPEGVRVSLPEKKPKGKELTKEQKERNREISSFRVRVEHAVCSVKRYRIVKDECRLGKNNFVDEVFIYCAALHNFRLKTGPFAYKNNLI